MQMIVAEHKSTPFGVVYVALEDLTHSMYMVQRIYDALNGEVDIILCMESSSRAKLFYQQITHPRIHVVNFLQSFTHLDSLLHEPLDTQAMELFSVHTSQEKQHTSTPTGSHVKRDTHAEWLMLDKDMKDTYRNSVLHKAVMERSMQHCATVSSLMPHHEHTSIDFGRMEHRRISAELRLAGWKYGAHHDQLRKEHPDLQAFDNLHTNVQQHYTVTSHHLLTYKSL